MFECYKFNTPANQQRLLAVSRIWLSTGLHVRREFLSNLGCLVMAVRIERPVFELMPALSRSQKQLTQRRLRTPYRAQKQERLNPVPTQKFLKSAAALKLARHSGSVQLACCCWSTW
jgi:hypothetical protein